MTVEQLHLIYLFSKEFFFYQKITSLKIVRWEGKLKLEHVPNNTDG